MKTEIKSFDDACTFLGIDPAISIIHFPEGFPGQYAAPLAAHAKLVVICDALNREANDGKQWLPDWNNWQEEKWYAWFTGSSSGAGFSFDDAVSWSTSSIAGSRLCFKTAEIAEYAGKQFEDLYKKYFEL